MGRTFLYREHLSGRVGLVSLAKGCFKSWVPQNTCEVDGVNIQCVGSKCSLCLSVNKTVA